MIKILLAGRIDLGVSERLKVIPEFEIQEREIESIPLLPDDLYRVDAAVLDSRIECERDLLSHATEIKLLVRIGSEFAALDRDFLASRGIEVRETPFSTPTAIADYTMGLILAGLNRIGPDYCMFHASGYQYRPAESLKEFRGKTLGIAGFSQNGVEIVELAIALGLKVISSDPTAIWTDLAVRHVPMEDLIRTSDILCFNLDRTPETIDLVSRECIGNMKSGALVIDFSAPGVVDQAGVVEALSQGLLIAAALDVNQMPGDEKRKAAAIPGLYPLTPPGKMQFRERERYGNDVVSILKGFFNV